MDDDGSPGVEMPMVVMGTGSGQKGEVDNATSLWLGRAGGIGIDTAYSYHDEDGIKEGVAKINAQRSDIFLETKVSSH